MGHSLQVGPQITAQQFSFPVIVDKSHYCPYFAVKERCGESGNLPILIELERQIQEPDLHPVSFPNCPPLWDWGQAGHTKRGNKNFFALPSWS
jgi:hypothetical protein